MSTLRIRFVREYEVKDELRTRYKVGQRLEMPEASAQHFISRGAAVPDDEPSRTEPLPLETDTGTDDEPSRKDKKAKK
jgi:hypothetical protein